MGTVARTARIGATTGATGGEIAKIVAGIGETAGSAAEGTTGGTTGVTGAKIEGIVAKTCVTGGTTAETTGATAGGKLD